MSRNSLDHITGMYMSHISKRKKAADALVDRSKVYTLAEAIEITKKTATTKFDSGVELHVRLGIDPQKADQIVRGTIALPHGTGKQKKIVVFAEGKEAELAEKAGAARVGGKELIKEISQTGKFPGDVAVATPDMMRFVSAIAKILGPKGLMPNPKNETVTKDVTKAVKELAAGKIPFRNDATSNIHLLVGRASFESSKLLENITIALDAIKRVKPSASKGAYLLSMYLSSSMGPSAPFIL